MAEQRQKQQSENLLLECLLSICPEGKLISEILTDFPGHHIAFVIIDRELKSNNKDYSQILSFINKRDPYLEYVL